MHGAFFIAHTAVGNFTELSEHFQRTQGAIKSRINKLMMEE